MQILDGKKTSSLILENIREKIEKLEKKPKLAVILANDNPASKVYVSSKEKTSKNLGIESVVYRFNSNAKQEEITSLIKGLNDNPEVNAILVQLPLFDYLNKSEILELIDPKKDVDGFHPVNVGRLNCGLKPYALCCTPKGIIRLLKTYNIELSGKNVLVVGRSNIVGRPLATLFTLEDSTVTLAHSKTKNLKDLAKAADIIVSAAGKPKLITSDMVSKGAVVVDVGITRQSSGKLVGDVDFDGVKDIASYITPVPGGVGPMTIAMLMENTLELYLEQNKR